MSDKDKVDHRAIREARAERDSVKRAFAGLLESVIHFASTVDCSEDFEDHVRWAKMARDGAAPGSLNPDVVFKDTASQLLINAVACDIDVFNMMEKELRNRGVKGKVILGLQERRKQKMTAGIQQ